MGILWLGLSSLKRLFDKGVSNLALRASTTRQYKQLLLLLFVVVSARCHNSFKKDNLLWVDLLAFAAVAQK